MKLNVITRWVTHRTPTVPAQRTGRCAEPLDDYATDVVQAPRPLGVDNAWEAHTAAAIRLVRPRRYLCDCGEPATRVYESAAGRQPLRKCADHAPRGVLGVIQGGRA